MRNRSNLTPLDSPIRSRHDSQTDSRSQSPLKRSKLYKQSVTVSNFTRKKTQNFGSQNDQKKYKPVRMASINNNLEQSTPVKGWFELKPDGEFVSRRAHHISFVYKKQLYIHGGVDYEGKIHSDIMRLVESDDACSWESVKFQAHDEDSSDILSKNLTDFFIN